MNYRHAYHAGNFADVMKHFVVGEVLARLQQKDSPLFFLDTHAGRGYYPLDDIAVQRGGNFVRARAAARTPESAYGSSRLCAQIRRLGEAEGHRALPGIAAHRARPAAPPDRAAFCEIEPLEAEALRATVRGDRRARSTSATATRPWAPCRPRRSAASC